MGESNRVPENRRYPGKQITNQAIDRLTDTMELQSYSGAAVTAEPQQQQQQQHQRLCSIPFKVVVIQCKII